MKIRTGFVSNSSSSSFIISSNVHNTVFDLAIAMLKIRNDNYRDPDKWGKPPDENIICIENDIINRVIREGKDPNTSILFNTCSFNTFIKRVANRYLVTTCNNHPFLEQLNGIIQYSSIINKWLKENGYLYKDYLEDSDQSNWSLECRMDDWKFQKEEVFWFAQYDIEISRYDYMAEKGQGYCQENNHFSEIMILASTREKICPICYAMGILNKHESIKSRLDILDFGDKDEN